MTRNVLNLIGQHVAVLPPQSHELALAHIPFPSQDFLSTFHSPPLPPPPPHHIESNLHGVELHTKGRQEEQSLVFKCGSRTHNNHQLHTLQDK